jgi:hypothetical protein
VREQLLTIDQVEQGHWLAAQGMDDVPVIDDVAVFAGGVRPPATQRHQRRRAKKAFEPIIVKAHAQAMADQAGGYRIEHLLEGEPAGRGNGDDRLLIIRRPVRRQCLQRRALEIEALAVASIAPADDLVDEAAIGFERVKIARAAQQQRVLDRPLQMAVRAFDRAVLVRQTPIVAGRLHTVMRAQRLVAPGLILPCVLVEVAEGSRQAVAAMLQRGPAERPQRILQTLRQGHEALTSEHDMRMFPAREGQAEVIEPVIERHAGDADAVIAHVGEIGQAQPTRRGLLPEDNVLLGPIERPPSADAPFQRATDTGADLGMAAPDLVENGHRPQAWGALQQRHYLAVPNLSQRIATSTAARRFVLRRQPWVLLDAIGGGGAEPGLGRSYGRRLGLAETHIQPHLAVGDVAAGQAVVPHRREEPASYRPTATARKHGPLRGPAGRQIRNSGRATPSLPHASGDAFSS